MSNYNIIIIGSGINSLSAAAKLSKSGKRVAVFEARGQIGGMAETVEFSNGFTCNVLNDNIAWLDPRLEQEFSLSSNGLKMIQPDPVRIALDENGNHIRFYKNIQKTVNSIAGHSESDADKWVEFQSYILNLTEFLKNIYHTNPPNLPHIGFSNISRFKSLLKPIMKQGASGFSQFMRTVPMMMPEMMDEWFESDLLRGAISAQAVKYLSQGPYAAATALNLLHQHVHADGILQNAFLVKRGTRQLAAELEKIGQSSGVEYNLSKKVESLLIEDNFCRGIQLLNGEKIMTEKVVSGLDTRNTFHQLVGPKNLNPEFNRQVKNIKFKGNTSRIHFALRNLPEMTGILPEEMSSVFTISPSINYIEKAFDETKYGRISENPVVEFSLPSLLNPEFSAEGKHVLSMTIQYTPYHLRDAEWDEHQKEKLYRNVMNVCKKYIPEIEQLVEEKHIISPLDMEEEYGLTEGSLSHGDLTLDQFWFMRPMIRSAQYQTPIKNLYLCGSGTHPGGGLHGANGMNAAQVILKE